MASAEVVLNGIEESEGKLILLLALPVLLLLPGKQPLQSPPLTPIHALVSVLQVILIPHTVVTLQQLSVSLLIVGYLNVIPLLPISLTYRHIIWPPFTRSTALLSTAPARLPLHFFLTALLLLRLFILLVLAVLFVSGFHPS